jgi:hypothetical protein
MTRLLLVETASPKRIRKKAEEILAGSIYSAPQIAVLCTRDRNTYRYLSEIPGIQVFPLAKGKQHNIIEELSARSFDVLYVFWTGEKRYRRMKLLALRLKAGVTHVDIGDGSVFSLTWKACLRHWQFRRAHPLPTDHWDFVPLPKAPGDGANEYYEGERILVVQSAEPALVLQALRRLQEKPLFSNPRFTVFCRNRPEIAGQFHNHPMVREILTHSETRGWWKHLRSLRKERYDAVVVFFSGDPSYWKIKYFAFLLGARHRVVFNEHGDCFYFNLHVWLALMAHRLGERSREGRQPGWTHQARILAFLFLKVLLIPFRIIWLLLVWVRLRSAAWLHES